MSTPDDRQTTRRPLDRLVTVCAECLCASCWHGEFYCESYRTAATTQRTVRELRALKLEHPSHYSVENVRRVCGG